MVLEITNQNIILSNKNPGIYNKKNDKNGTGYTPAFKGGIDTFLNKSGWLMNKIESGGFLVLFLIQDFLGMTLPRTCAGFLRDKEVTGEYNIQEGFEVLGREGLTGPCMMAMAPLCLWLASKPFGQSTSVNTELIKRYGNSLSCLMFDLDFFKVVNDIYGYEWGDVLLRSIADKLKQLIRKEDVLTRYGDEEFVLILPNI